VVLLLFCGAVFGGAKTAHAEPASAAQPPQAPAVCPFHPVDHPDAPGKGKGTGPCEQETHRCLPETVPPPPPALPGPAVLTGLPWPASPDGGSAVPRDGERPGPDLDTLCVSRI
jgi:hypothetical protein